MTPAPRLSADQRPPTGAVLGERRRAAGLFQRQIAAAAGLSCNTIRNVERSVEAWRWRAARARIAAALDLMEATAGRPGRS